MHKETNPHNALALIQAHGDREVWFNPPPIPLSTPELDWVFEQPYQRRPHPTYGDAKIPALEMIQHSVNIMRGCFGGCTFCSITEHEGESFKTALRIPLSAKSKRFVTPAQTSQASSRILAVPRLICGASRVKARKSKQSAGS